MSFAPGSTAQKVLDKLASYKIKKEGDKEYRCNSPLRSGSDSHSFVVTIEGDEHGAFFDHKSEERGSLYELAKKLNIDLPAKQVENTKRPYKGIADYAAAHGVSVEVLQKAGWREVSYQRRPALEFPTKTGNRYRFLDGKKPHYISPKSYQRSWYGLDEKAFKRVLMGQPLVLCNGEISTVVGRNFGVAVACVTSGEKSEIPPDLMEELIDFLDTATTPNNTPLVLVALDCDSKGHMAAKGIEKQIRDAGYKARAVDLNLSKGGDFSDFCMLHHENTDEALAGLPTLKEGAATDTRFRPWIIMHSEELHKLPTIEWIIPREIQAMGINVIYGPSGVGKSFLALHYALTVAQDRPVVYMAGEGVYGYNKRISAWEKYHKSKRSNLYICTGAVSLLDPDDFRMFIDDTRHFKPALVIVDTLARSMVGGDENSSQHMGMFIRACDEIKATLGCAVLLVHHTNKGRNEERGSGSLRGAADVMIKVSGEGDLIIVESDKVKDDNPLPLRYFKLLPVQVESSESAESQTSMVFVEAEKIVQTKDDLLSQNQQKIMRQLADLFTDGLSVKELSEETRIGRGSVQRDIKKMIELGFVQQDSPGAPYFVTPAGKEVLEKTLKSDDSLTHMTRVFSEPDDTRTLESRESTESRESLESAESANLDALFGDEPKQGQFVSPQTKSQYSEGY